MITSVKHPNLNYVRYNNQYQKWYRAVLVEGAMGKGARVSRKKFSKADSAVRYARLVHYRLSRLQACMEVLIEESD